MAERLHQARNGSGSVVFVVGESGIGKSRLVAQALGAAGGFRIARGRCPEHTRLPLGPIEDVLRDARGDRRETRQIPPAIAAADETIEPLAAAWACLEHWGEHGPCVVLLEDIHWAQVATLEFIAHAAERVARIGMLVACTLRAEELRPGDPECNVILRTRRTPDSWTLEVPPLSSHEARELAAGAIAPAASLDPSVLPRVAALAEGNPLVIEELARYAASGGDVHHQVPESLGDIAFERLARLEEAERRVLVAASAFRPDFDPEVLVRVALPWATDARAALRRAHAMRVLCDDGDRMAFRHAFMREALYASMMRADAVRLHHDIAEVLEAGAARCGIAFAEAAYHWWAAGDAAKAVAFNERAGDEAVAVPAPSDAAPFFERAVRFASANARATLLVKLGDALGKSGAPRRALRVLDEALAHFEVTGDHQRAALACLAIGWECFNHPDLGDALAWHRLALASLESDRRDPVATACRATMARLLAMRGEAAEALEMAAGVDGTWGASSDSLVSLCEARAFALGWLGDVEGAVAAGRSAVEVAASSGSRLLLSRASANLALVAAPCGSVEVALTAAERAVALCREARMPLLLGFALSAAAGADAAAGRLGAAAVRIAEAGRIAATLDSPRLRGYVAMHAVTIGLRLERLDLIELVDIADAYAVAVRSQDARWLNATALAFAELLLARGDREGAWTVTEAALRSVAYIGLTPNLALAAAAAGTSTATREVRSRLVAWSAAGGNTIGAPTVALFDAIAGEGDAPQLAAAANQFASAGLRLHEAAALEYAGDVPRAAAIYREIDSAFDLRRLRDAKRVAAGPDALSGRELDVLEQIVRGKSNRAIANILGISERTVESHLRSIYAKVGVTSRLELATSLDTRPTHDGRKRA